MRNRLEVLIICARLGINERSFFFEAYYLARHRHFDDPETSYLEYTERGIIPDYVFDHVDRQYCGEGVAALIA